MKKILKIIRNFFFIAILIVCGCQNNKEDRKAALAIGDMNVTTYQTISLAELDAKIEAKDSFLLYVYDPMCGSCASFKPIIENAIKTRHLLVYAILYIDIKPGHELKSLDLTPSIVVYDEGEILVKKSPNSKESYFDNNEGFLSFLDKYTYMPTMFYINRSQLRTKIDNDENFIIYYSRKTCGDCAYLNENYLKEYLNSNPNTKHFYVIETDVEGIRYNEGTFDQTQWQSFKDEFGLSENGNSSYGFGVRYTPSLQYYEDGEIADMVVYFGDIYDSVVNDDGSTTITITDSYYSDNPYLNTSMQKSDYKKIVESFHNEKLKKFLDTNLIKVD